MERPIDLAAEPRRLETLAPRALRTAGGLGVVGLVAALIQGILTEEGMHRFYHAYLVNLCYFLSLSLGALFFVMLQHLTRAGWSVVIRRFAEGLTAPLPMLAVLCIPILVGRHELYSWTRSGLVAEDHLLQLKQPYLNTTFFIIRLAACFAIWMLLARFFFANSVRQDMTGDVNLTLRMQAISGPGMVLFAITLTVAAVDLLMSLDPHWYSTIFGVYYYAGGVVGFFALLALVVFLAQSSGRLPRVITIEHYHDMGKLIFAFVVFWAYIAFSQYLLIWYANIPEETVWFLHRQDGDWGVMSLVLLFGHFVVPFLALISRRAKRRKASVAVTAVWVLSMHWLDIYWLVMPGVSEGHLGLSLMDLTCFIGIGGLFVATAVLALREHSLIPARDPRLIESLTFENV
ncbi:MAG: hypothetical protein JSU68_07205 [Phycisphaerales bacterium]|nr:MAG: hypothetical protein JSU68_07205 [Phycisphaerales bacterium]